ncbi:NUDIX hydrolase [Anaerorhabdus sp.]|jgi:ADP-ribose pyrophosphatase|uniref:NUDIX hydrolase n=1 Tax=Anaerorhabdus sp. TaxID=1872524 RepID=UPI002FC64DAE
MKLNEKTLKQELKFKGKLINVRHDEVELPNNEIALREVVEHPGGVAVAMINNEGKFFMVEQYRYAQQKVLLEFPAGKMEKGEDPLETAKREVIEETGYSGKDYVYLGRMVPTGAYLEEKIEMYMATTDQYMGQKLDEDEFVKVSTKSIDELVDMIMNREIEDGKTIAMTFMIKEIMARNKK